MEWTRVEDGLPEIDRLLLVRLTNWNLAAMAVLISDLPDCWKVQPLFNKWYVARNCDVTHWMLLPGPGEDSLPEQEKEQTIIHLNIHCDSHFNEALCEAIRRCLIPVRIKKVDDD